MQFFERKINRATRSKNCKFFLNKVKNLSNLRREKKELTFSQKTATLFIYGNKKVCFHGSFQEPFFHF